VVVQVEVDARAFAATWVREETGEVVGTTLGNTMCWNPRRPWALTIEHEGDRLIAPCGECPGCLEFLRRRLADRLKARYGTKLTRLWIVRIWYPLELQAVLAHKLHRRKGLELEPGWYRLGVDSFAILSREKRLISALLKAIASRHHAEPVRLSRGRRAWRSLTAGLLVSRAVYGEHTNRWYARGLPPAERLRWDVVKRAMQKPWRRRTGARVRTGSRIILVPPAIWSMDGDRMREYRAAAAGASSPEEAMANRRRVAEIVAGAASHLKLDAPAQPALTREQVQTFYATMARRKAARASETPAATPNPSTLLGGGLRSSVHSLSTEGTHDAARELETWLHSGAPPPEMGRERDYEDWLDETWSDGRTRRAILGLRLRDTREQDKAVRQEKFLKELADWVERMRSKIRGG
jgi:hypothetical protein